MANKKALQLILLLATVLVFAVVLVALNTVTGPRIEANNNSALYEPLYEVMPEAKGFTQLSVSAADTVKSVWKETSGKGYVIQLATNKGYTGQDIEITVAFSTDGKIYDIKLVSYPETRDFGTELYPASFVGQDSTLAGVSLVSGCTYSSKAFKGAVEDAFSVLIDNGFIGAGVKEPSQVISEMLPVVNPDMCSETGMLQAKEVEVAGTVKAWASDSGKTVAFWFDNGTNYLAIVDSDGVVTAYDLDGNNVTKLKNTVVTDAETAYQKYQDILNAKDLEEISSLIEGAAGFKKLSVSAPDTVRSVWQETSGKGYVVRCATNKGFTHEFINLSVAFTADGKISNIVLETYPETRDFGPDYPATYIGQDSTLSGVQIVAGVTYSSVAFKGAVADAFEALTSNGLVVEAVKEPSQVIDEMIPEKATGLVNPQGIFQGEEIEASGNVVKAWASPKRTVAAYWVNEDGIDYLALANAYGCVTVYDLKGNDVTSEAAKVASDIDVLAAGVLAASSDKEIKKVTKLVPDFATYASVAVEGLFSSVSDVIEAQDTNGKVYYGFICHTYGFGNHDMAYYIVLDEEGKIVDMNTSTLIIDAEYFNVSVKKADYVAAIKGVTADWTGEEALIAGATLTTQSTQTAINDAFEVFKLLTGGAN